jgi:hypothetical protein
MWVLTGSNAVVGHAPVGDCPREPMRATEEAAPLLRPISLAFPLAPDRTTLSTPSGIPRGRECPSAARIPQAPGAFMRLVLYVFHRSSASRLRPSAWRPSLIRLPRRSSTGDLKWDGTRGKPGSPTGTESSHPRLPSQCQAAQAQGHQHKQRGATIQLALSQHDISIVHSEWPSSPPTNGVAIIEDNARRMGIQATACMQARQVTVPARIPQYSIHRAWHKRMQLSTAA